MKSYPIALVLLWLLLCCAACSGCRDKEPIEPEVTETTAVSEGTAMGGAQGIDGEAMEEEEWPVEPL